MAFNVAYVPVLGGNSQLVVYYIASGPFHGFNLDYAWVPQTWNFPSTPVSLSALTDNFGRPFDGSVFITHDLTFDSFVDLSQFRAVAPSGVSVTMPVATADQLAR